MPPKNAKKKTTTNYATVASKYTGGGVEPARQAGAQLLPSAPAPALALALALALARFGVIPKPNQ